MGYLRKRRQHYGLSGSLKKANLCIAISGLSMSTVKEESDTVTIDTVNSVTLTQDTEGNLILHCPQNGMELFYVGFLSYFFIDLTLTHLQIIQAVLILFTLLKMLSVSV